MRSSKKTADNATSPSEIQVSLSLLMVDITRTPESGFEDIISRVKPNPRVAGRIIILEG